MYLNYLQILIKIYESKIKKKKDKKNSLVLLFLQKTKKHRRKDDVFCRSGPTRTGDRLHPMQEC